MNLYSRAAFVLPLFLAGASAAPAQDFPVPAPAPELARYDVLLGTFEGRGTVSMGEEQQMQWSSRTFARRVMNGHFVRADTVIEIAGEDAEPMQLGFITHYGWDPERERYVFYELSNMGTLVDGDVHWLEDGSMVTVASMIEEGQPKVERWITHFSDDGQHFVGEEAIGDGPWHVHVTGGARRVENGPHIDASRLGAFFAEPGAEMQKASRMSGSYNIEGKFRMVPEQPMMPFTAHEEHRVLFGGLAIEYRTTGQPGNYEAWAVLTWDPTEQRYRMASIGNMGMLGTSEGWLFGDDWVFTTHGTFLGQPMVTRMVLKTDQSGHIVGVYADALAGVAEPYRSFEATYRLQKDAASSEGGSGSR